MAYKYFGLTKYDDQAGDICAVFMPTDAEEIRHFEQIQEMRNSGIRIPLSMLEYALTDNEFLQNLIKSTNINFEGIKNALDAYKEEANVSEPSFSHS